MAVQPDDKILVTGSFTSLAGQPASGLARLNSDGTADPSFTHGTDMPVMSLALLEDGRTLLGGAFNYLDGQRLQFMARLNTDASVDTNFNLHLNGPVYCLLVQQDGSVLIGGGFTSLGGQPRTNLARLNPDGTLDMTFNPGASPNASFIDDHVYSFALQADGKILVGGGFNALGGKTRNCLGRLNTDGSLDTNFNASANGPVYALAVQPDGKILVGGGFSMFGIRPRNYIGRLNADSSVDTTFNPGASGGSYPVYGIQSLTLQADGKIVITGGFTSVAGTPCDYVGRVNPGGSLDSTFQPSANYFGKCLALQADGKLLVGGYFTTIGGTNRNRIARLTNTDSATQALTYDGSTISWLRGGTSPEVFRTLFYASTNAVDWVALGAGSRVTGGWQLAGVPLPARATVRARGFISGGLYNGSAWFVESTMQTALEIPLTILQDTQFGFLNTQFGFNVTGQPGNAVVMESSADLVTWKGEVTNTLGTAPLYFTDPSSVTNTWRFYRARYE
jgi:uncharacterized delta-60 repeat protein